MSFSDQLLKSAEDAKILVADINAMAYSHRQGYSDPASRKSIESITILRKNKEELIKAQEADPELQFVYDKLNQIIGG